ncbi:alpha/beta fold hydrolase [Streptomyces sp. NPDC048638]|uniref:alpha/beta fold hydrolase n=1 Tax=Streptomyces sp. NPDC048638 TaxID=3365580 RepID=UPI0037122A12
MHPGMRATHLMLALISRDWAGLPIALLVAAGGGWCTALGAAWVVPGALLLGVAALLAAGSLRHLVHVARAGASNPPPGRMVDVGGHRMHLLAEGDSATRPAVVWMPGGHAPGHAMHHLHTMLREHTRSILIDRPGSGWSDAGPFPRTTATEAAELLTVLERAGEEGPFVFVGHSFGGLLVANAARCRPDLVAGLVLLDPTPPDVITYGPPNPVLRQSGPRLFLRSAVRKLFGIHSGAGAEPSPAVGSRTRADCAAASIFRELTPAGMAAVGWQTMVYDGDLGDLPLLLVAPRDLTGGEQVLDAAGDPEEAVRVRRFYLTTRERFLATSTMARRVHAPEGTGHGFPDEVPGFVAETVRTLLSELESNRPAPSS